MPNSTGSIYALYEQMIDIMKRQLADLEQPIISNEKLTDMLEQEADTSEIQLQNYNALSLDFALLAQKVDRSIEVLESEELDRLREHAIGQVQIMQTVGNQIEKKLHQLQQQSGLMIGRVQQNRTVVRSYGGLDMVDTTPMYFDEKN